VITTGVVAATLVIATVISIWQATVARRAEALAEQRLAAEQQARRQAIAALAVIIGERAETKEWNQIVAQLTTIASMDPSGGLDVTRVLLGMAQHESTHESQNQHKLEEAERVYRQVLMIFREHYRDYDWPVLAVSGRLLAVALAKEDHPTVNEVRSRAEKALELVKSDKIALRHAASIFVALKEWKSAEACSARTIELDLSSVHPRHCVALLQFKQKNQEGYRATCNAIVAQAERLPNYDFHSRYFAAWTCLLGPESGVARARIDALVRRALDVKPKDPFYIQAAAIALYRSGRYEEAEKRFVESIRLNSGEEFPRGSIGYAQVNAAFSRLFLAMTQERLNRHDEARASLQLGQHAADSVLHNNNPRIGWDYQLALKLWSEESARVVLAGNSETDAVSNSPGMSDETTGD
jgi:tetratricopeptide (TPR) repeat protein